MRTLVDLDGVLADFEGGFLEAWRQRRPDAPFIPLEHRTTFYISQQYPPAWREAVLEVMRSPGFFRGLAPISGGREAAWAMRQSGWEVFICTSPLSPYGPCALEKYQWVEQHLGGDWVDQVILARDKTVIRGDILIDDRPEVAGVETPAWEHVIYDQPYNRLAPLKRRLTWDNWRVVLGLP